MDGNKTGLTIIHKKLGAKIVDFHGWLMPIQYSSIIDEYWTVRKTSGLFDISHMGEIILSGDGALEYAQKLLTNNVDVENGKCVYSPMCNDSGGIIDDLIAYRQKDDEFMFVVNSANLSTDLEWIEKNKPEDVGITDKSSTMGAIAIQGPRSMEIMDKLSNNLNLKRFHFTNNRLNGVDSLISRTGYTGEDGYEIYFPWESSKIIWEKLTDVGASPCGLGSRDILRLEMGYMLHGNDISIKSTPIEAGLSWAVDFKKTFIGKSSLKKQVDEGPVKRLIGFKCLEKGIPRTGYAITNHSGKIGEVTSGNFSPILNQGIGLGYVGSLYSNVGDNINIVIRGNSVKAEITKPPFIKKVK